jgi:uncharacterized protein YajQ (UPF0234 family)
MVTSLLQRLTARGIDARGRHRRSRRKPATARQNVTLKQGIEQVLAKKTSLTSIPAAGAGADTG